MKIGLLTLLFFSVLSAGCPLLNDSPELKDENQPANSDLPFTIDTLATGLQNPWGLVFLSENDILITERPGRLILLNLRNGSIKEIKGLPKVASVGQGGLLDIKLHPGFNQNHLVYLSYSKEVPGGYTTVIGCGKFEKDQLVDFKEIFEARPAFSTTHHFGSRLVFFHNYLYFSVGDRGQMNQAQMLDRHNGKIMRLHHDGGVPDDNPFRAVSNARPEIWSYGHRNPQGLMIHEERDEIWAHEHGPKGGDELNVIRKGANYGWPKITYGIDYDGSVISKDTASKGMEQPVTYWVPSIAPCGMAFLPQGVYEGWGTSFFIGGLTARALYRVELKNDKVVKQEKLLDGIARVRNVVRSPANEIYVATESPGFLFRLKVRRK